ncbi:DMT family transporter [Desulfosporosinus sp. SB140]|uniref:DMT family transporter n=1 Tax=Desulfosporosinus paludis TaxID=3115649 RepID=UPI003890584D
MTLNWFYLVLIYIVMNSISKLIQKYVMEDEVVDPTAFGAFWHLMSGIIGLPFIFTAKLIYPHSLKIWLIVLLSASIYSACLLLYYHALNNTELSQTEAISTTRSIWFVILGALFFEETLNLSKLLGVGLIFAGLLVIYYQKRAKTSFGKHHIFVLVYALLVSCAYALDKFALGYFSVGLYNSLLYFLPGTITIILFPRTLEKMKHLIRPRKNNYLILLSCFVQIISTLSLYAAYQIGELSVVGPLAQTSTVLTIIFGIFLLKERWNLKRKITGIAIVSVGVIFLKFSVF